MRIAFASCMSAQVFPQQPVWDWIAAAGPDHVVLLGDSIYLDVFAPKHPKEMSNVEFAQHLLQRYRAQLAQPQFNRLLKGMRATKGLGRVHAIWDDHDFLWDNAAGAAIRAQPPQRDKIPLSSAFFKAFRQALDAPDTYPADYNAAQFWNPVEPAPVVQSLLLENELWLHLSDSRSWRTEVKWVPQEKRELLGSAQQSQLQEAMAAHPDAVHVLANGSTSKDWQDYRGDWSWLKAQAALRRTMLLSGDIHHNNVDVFETGGYPLHEATSSGAAVNDAVVLGKLEHNYGVLDVSATELALRFFEQGNVENQPLARVYRRDSWLRQLG